MEENIPKLGRPTKYKQEYCEMLYEHMSKGFSYESFAGIVRVCRDTLYQWEKDFPEFSYIKKCGKDASLLQYEKLILDMANGLVDGNSTAAVWYGKNMFGWTDKREHSLDADTKNTLKLLYKVD